MIRLSTACPFYMITIFISTLRLLKHLQFNLQCYNFLCLFIELPIFLINFLHFEYELFLISLLNLLSHGHLTLGVTGAVTDKVELQVKVLGFKVLYLLLLLVNYGLLQLILSCLCIQIFLRLLQVLMLKVNLFNQHLDLVSLSHKLSFVI
jgi:hypothetical protein